MKKGIIFLIGFLLFLFLNPDINFATESDEKDNSNYSKQEKDYWIKVISNNERVQDFGVIKNFGQETAKEKYGPIAGQKSLGFFLPYVLFPVESCSDAVAIGDVNGDDLNDVVLTTSSSYTNPENDNDFKLFVFIQDVSGELLAPVKYDAGDGDSVDIGDLNNDGRNDVVVTNSTSIGVFLQNDTGTLDSMISYTTTNEAFKVRIGDFNNDGLADVASIAWGSHLFGDEVNVFLQNIDGTLNTPDIYTVIHEGYDDLDLGDINNDGLTDIIIMSGQLSDIADDIGVLYQNAEGTFDLAVYYDLVGNVLYCKGVAVGDVNGDALKDVVVTYRDRDDSPYDYIGIFYQNETGTLDSPIRYSFYQNPQPVVIGDVNDDARQDVIVAHDGSGGGIGVFLQRSDGSLLDCGFYSLYPCTHYLNPHALAGGDINGDDNYDVVISDFFYGLLILYGTGVQTYSLTINAGAEGTTYPAPGIYIQASGAQIHLQAVPNSGYQFSAWSGYASGTTNPITITMDSDKSITANFVQIPNNKDAENGSGDGCFIATAAYGSPLHPYVEILRKFRDKYLFPNKAGCTLVSLYYKYSPFVANKISRNKPLKAVTRIYLLPVIVFCCSMVHLGPIITGVILILFFMLPFFLLKSNRRKLRQVR